MVLRLAFGLYGLFMIVWGGMAAALHPWSVCVAEKTRPNGVRPVMLRLVGAGMAAAGVALVVLAFLAHFDTA